MVKAKEKGWHKKEGKLITSNKKTSNAYFGKTGSILANMLERWIPRFPPWFGKDEYHLLSCHLPLDSSYATWFQHNQGRTITKLYGIEHWAARKSANQFTIPICFGTVYIECYVYIRINCSWNQLQPTDRKWCPATCRSRAKFGNLRRKPGRFVAEHRPSRKETIVLQPSIFRCQLSVAGRVPVFFNILLFL